MVVILLQLIDFGEDLVFCLFSVHVVHENVEGWHQHDWVREGAVICVF